MSVQRAFPVVAALAASFAAIAASAPVVPEAVTLDAQLRQAKADAATADAERQRLEQSAAKARDEAERLRLQQVAAASAISAAEARITAADMQLRLSGEQLRAQRARLAREQAPTSSLLAALALVSRRPPLLLLADSKSPEELVKLRLLLDSTMPAIRARTAALSAELRETERLRTAAAAARTAASASRKELSSRAAELVQLEKRAAAVARSRGRTALVVGDVAIAREEQSRALEAEAGSSRSAAALAAELAKLGPAPERPFASDGPKRFPPLAYRLPANRRVVEGFGTVSNSGIRSRGITLATRRGQAVVAPADGTVLFSGPFRQFDGVVIIDHGRGWKTVLVGVASTVPKAARVAAGQRLGTALGPLEVQLQQNGRPVSAALIAGSSAMLSNTRKGV